MQAFFHWTPVQFTHAAISIMVLYHTQQHHIATYVATNYNGDAMITNYGVRGST